jgi:hypothetical protein
MPLHDDIAELLGLPERGNGAPTLAALEATLTDGYAQALALEAERWRIERRLGEVAREAGQAGSASELTSLSERLTDADAELVQLRTLLRSLQQRARARRSVKSS